MFKSIQLRGTVFAGLAVVLGAFGAHALKAVLPLSNLATFETGVKYQFLHALALIALSLSLANAKKYSPSEQAAKWMNRGAMFFTIGIILFSGSLYLLAIRPILPFTLGAWVGPITPLGGLFFILGWTSWSIAILRG